MEMELKLVLNDDEVTVLSAALEHFAQSTDSKTDKYIALWLEAEVNAQAN